MIRPIPLTAALAATALIFLPACGGNPQSEPEYPEAPPPPEGESDAQMPGETGQPGQPGQPEQPGQPGGEPGGAGMAPEGQPRAGAQGAPGGSAAAEVSKQEVEEFSNVQVEMIEITQAVQKRAQKGEDPAALQSELEQEANRLVDESPLSEERFREIGNLARQDPQLRTRIEQSIQQKVEPAGAQPMR